MKYKLPPVDESALKRSLSAYRAAVQHETRVVLKWEPRMREISKADEFSGLYCRYESETYLASKLCEFAGDVFLAAATRRRPYPESVYAGVQKDFFDRYSEADAKKVVAKVRAAYKAVNRTKIVDA